MTNREQEPAEVCRQILSNDQFCAKPQRGLIHWLGREPLPCCEPHIAKARRIAEVLGCTLQVTITHSADGDDIEQRFSMIEPHGEI